MTQQGSGRNGSGAVSSPTAQGNRAVSTDGSHAEPPPHQVEPSVRNRLSPLLLRIPEAAAELGLARSTVYLLIQTGQLPVIRIGRAVRIPRVALEEWIEQRLREQRDGEELNNG